MLKSVIIWKASKFLHQLLEVRVVGALQACLNNEVEQRRMAKTERCECEKGYDWCNGRLVCLNVMDYREVGEADLDLRGAEKLNGAERRCTSGSAPGLVK